jgi:hypothetical protein
VGYFAYKISKIPGVEPTSTLHAILNFRFKKKKLSKLDA